MASVDEEAKKPHAKRRRWPGNSISCELGGESLSGVGVDTEQKKGDGAKKAKKGKTQFKSKQGHKAGRGGVKGPPVFEM